MFKHYFNMAILYMCLYGKEDLITENSIRKLNFTDKTFDSDDVLRIANFIKLHKDSPEKNSRITHYTTTKKGTHRQNSAFNPRSFAAYFYGATYNTWYEKNKSYGSKPSSPDTANLSGNCLSFISLFPPTNQAFEKLLICALTKDNIEETLINSIIDKINSKDMTWFFDVYRVAIRKDPGYFESDTDRTDLTVLDRFAKVEESCEQIYSEQIEKYNKEKANKEKTTVTSVDDNTDIHQLAVDWFKTQSSTGRYDSYGKTKGKRRIKEIKNKLDTDDGEPRYLIDIIFDGSDNTHSINLCGKGGSGKTFQILHAIDKILNERPTILPFYIPLSSLEFSDLRKNCIIEYLVREDEFPKDLVKKTLDEYKSNLILFADGLNEISDPKIRRKIAIDICNLRQKYKTRFLVSSRLNYSDLFNTLDYGDDSRFKKAEVLDLTEAQINEYFTKINCSVSYKDVPVQTRKLLETPQGCVMYAELIGSDLENTMNITSLGRLLECYCNSLLGVASNSQFNSFEKPLMEIGYNMVLHGWFKISEDEIMALDNITTEELNILFSDTSPTWSIFVKNDDKYEFTHQNYRDLYCAKKFALLINAMSPKTLSQDLESIFVTNNITMNDEILELTSAFIEDGRTSIQTIIDIIRQNEDILTGNYKGNYDFPLSRLIRIYAFAHENNISGLDLSKLDLTEVCLNGYELYDRKSDKGINLSDAKINYNTILKVGFPTGSSAICSFIQNNKTYIIAFDRTTAMIIDVEENQKQLVRNLDDYGWVNYALPTTIKGKSCILLGCDSGKLAVFYPVLSGNSIKEFFVDTKIKSKDGIQSIVQFKRNDMDYFAFCNTDGWIFFYNCSNDQLLDPISVCNEEERLNVINEWKDYASKSTIDPKMFVACRMDYDEPNNQLIVSFGNKLYKVDLKSDEFDITEYEIDWKYQVPRLIKDIKITPNYIFINEVDAISVIHNRVKCWEFVIDQKAHLSYREKYLREILKLDKEFIEDVLAFEKKNSTPFDGKITSFHFQKFSSIPANFYHQEEGVLVGIKTSKEVLYKQLPQFFEIRIRSSCKSITKNSAFTTIHTNQSLATHTGVYYKLKSIPDTILLATTSDDRSLDLIAPHNEEFVPQHIEGAYNGVRHIEIIDDKHFVCAQYDGTLILFSHDKYHVKNEIRRVLLWKVSNVIKPHHDWVWEVKSFEEWTEKEQKVVSCSYDGTVRITDFSNSESSIPIIKTTQHIRGVYKEGCNIWAYSSEALYHAEYKGEDKWVSDEPYDEKKLGVDGLNINLLENLGNDAPYVFYNSGVDAQGNNTQGYIAILADRSKLTTIITCESGVFLRKIKPYHFNGNDYLFVAGTKDKVAYIAIYQKTDNEYISPPISVCCPSSTPDDFIIVDLEIGRFVIFVSRNKICFCKVDDDMNLTSSDYDFDVDGRPLCISSRGDLILVGLLNGKILKITFSDNGFKCSDFVFTHANLYSTPNVDIGGCDIQDDEATFFDQLKDYFSI